MVDVLHGSAGRAGVLAGLVRRVGADVAGGRGEGVEQLRVSDTGLTYDRRSGRMETMTPCLSHADDFESCR